MEFTALFQPIRIGKKVIKNRIGKAPIALGSCDGDGTPNDDVLCHYVACAKNDLGLIIVEHTFCTWKYGSQCTRILGCYHDRQLDRWRRLADSMHFFGAVGVVQLSCGLGVAASPKWGEVVGPSDIPIRVQPGTMPRGLKFLEPFPFAVPRPLTLEEIAELESAFEDAAARLQKAGFDGIEVHGAHGYLISNFVSPLYNQRTDRYGGSLEGRMRLPLNLIRRVRERCGDRFIIGYRHSVDEHDPQGYGLEDSKVICRMLIEAGVDYLDLDSGQHSNWQYTLPNREGMFLDEVAAMKAYISKSSQIPILMANIHTPKIAREVLESGKIDMVLLGRALMADPEWAKKVKEGQVHTIRKCTKENTCLYLFFNDLNVRCTTNSYLGWEKYMPEFYPPPVRYPRVEDGEPYPGYQNPDIQEIE